MPKKATAKAKAKPKTRRKQVMRARKSPAAGGTKSRREYTAASGSVEGYTDYMAGANPSATLGPQPKWNAKKGKWVTKGMK